MGKKLFSNRRIFLIGRREEGICKQQKSFKYVFFSTLLHFNFILPFSAITLSCHISGGTFHLTFSMHLAEMDTLTQNLLKVFLVYFIKDLILPKITACFSFLHNTWSHHLCSRLDLSLYNTSLSYRILSNLYLLLNFFLFLLYLFFKLIFPWVLFLFQHQCPFIFDIILIAFI